MSAPAVRVPAWEAGPVPEGRAGERRGAGLCLSGGGYRATLFHLGATRRLLELGLLRRLDTVSSVSGGSLLGGRLAVGLPWDRPGPFSEAEWEGVAGGVRQLCATDIRTGPIARRLLPWRWPGPPAIWDVAERLEAFLGRRPLGALPASAEFVICASDLGNQANFTFRRERCQSWRTEPIPTDRLNWTLAQAVAVSACFPPVFRPVRLRHPLTGETLLLNDGGNYDNMGLEPVWKRRALVLVSDGGGRPERRVRDTLVGHLRHYVSLGDTQTRSLRRRWLISSAQDGKYDAVYWAVSQDAQVFAPPLSGRPAPPSLRFGYAAREAARIAHIRTDLNRFTPGEQAVLENHGYLLADVALYTFLKPPWRPESWPELQVPHPQWLGEAGVARALGEA